MKSVYAEIHGNLNSKKRNWVAPHFPCIHIAFGNKNPSSIVRPLKNFKINTKSNGIGSNARHKS